MPEEGTNVPTAGKIMLTLMRLVNAVLPRLLKCGSAQSAAKYGE